MSTMVEALYRALREAGVDEPVARAAADAVLARNPEPSLVTRPDLEAEFKTFRFEIRAEMAELKADLIKWNLGAMAILTAIFAAISRIP